MTYDGMGQRWHNRAKRLEVENAELREENERLRAALDALSARRDDQADSPHDDPA